MASEEVTNKPVSSLQQFCEQAKVGEEAKALLTDQYSTKEFIGLLVKRELFADALRMVAFLLPRREAIGWACLCVRHVLPNPQEKPLPAVQVAAPRTTCIEFRVEPFTS